jgi:hypothetical protein
MQPKFMADGSANGKGSQAVARGVHFGAKARGLVHSGQIPLQKQEKSRVDLFNTGYAGSIRTEVGRTNRDQAVLVKWPAGNDAEPLPGLRRVWWTIENPFDGDHKLGRPFRD